MVPGFAALLDENEAAAILRVKPCTVRNERVRGKLGFTKIGKRVFYTAEQLHSYLQTQSVQPCVGAIPPPSPAKSVTIGSPKIPIALERATRGAELGTIDQAARHAVLALAQQTFRRQASSLQTGSSRMAKLNPISDPTKS